MKLQHDYKVSRKDFINRNVPKLEKVLKAQEGKVNAELNNLRAKHEEMLLHNSVNSLLVMSPADQEKVEAMARQDAVKEA